MNFTKSQQNAIDVRDCSLIVSAGAGSGKTAVLTERILERICDENDDCNIDDFLIVTFTNAAAKELSDRIRKKLSERAAAEPLNKKIINNIALMPLARISTINSFCYEVVRNNFQKTGLSASVRIADDAEMALIREKLMNEVLDEYFEEKGDDEVFLSAFEIFSSAKNDKGFVSTLLDLDSKLRCLPDPDAFCNDVLNRYKETACETEFFATKMGEKLMRNTVYEASRVENIMESLMDVCGKYPALADAYMPGIECERDFARSILIACKEGYSSVRNAIENSGKVSLKAVRNFENPIVKDLVKDCKNSVAGGFRKDIEEKFACDIKSLSLAAMDTYDVIAKLFELVGLFSEKLDARKKELGIIEFSDAERYALNLLVKSTSPFEVTELANSLRHEFTEIYIDEYQDVNPLQDLIFRAISRHSQGTECSRFMVGDIKQSIYRFRGARSDIFMSYRDNFDDVSSDSLTKRIFMSDNFRCCESVIELTNKLFSKLMSEYYTEGDSLTYSRKEEFKTEYKAELLAFSYNKDEADGIASDELEAALICEKIKEVVYNPDYTDSNGKQYGYCDVGILTRSKQALKTYEKFLEENGVPVMCDVGESFFDKKETILCLNILNSIDNPERDIFLAGFMRSFAGGFSDDELALIKKEYRKMSLYRAVINYSENFDNELAQKCGGFVEKLREYRNFSRGKSAEKLLWKIFCEMDLLNRCSSEYFTTDKKGTRKNLLKLYQMARDFSKTSFRGLSSFIEYLDGAMKNSDVKSERDSSSDCVRLMTIHASKGLEFPICFVSNLSKKFNKSDESSRLVFSENAGIATTLCDTASLRLSDTGSGLLNINTPFRKLINSETDKELCDEETRILYVAMTRARDMLFLTSAFPKKIENTMKDALQMNFTGDFSSANNYLSLILGVFADSTVLIPFYSASGIGYEPKDGTCEKYLECRYYTCEDMVEKCCPENKKEAAVSEQHEDVINHELLEGIRSAADADYDYRKYPSKLTVSRLKKGLIDEEHLVSDTPLENGNEITPRFISDTEEFDAAQKGTAMHMFMQFARYDECEKDCEKEADRLFEDGFIDEMQRKHLDIGKLTSFFKSSFYSEIAGSKRIYREQRFNLNVDAFDKSLQGDILVQGVIDLFFENDDGTYTVVDFKTDRVFGDDAESVLIDRHKEQLMYYKRAVEEMTGCEVKHTYIYSFSLMKEIEVD